MKYVLVLLALVLIAVIIRGNVMMELGQLSAKYESNGSPATISTGKGDKGGKSYGLYQLSLDTGALSGYVHASKYKAEFAGVILGSKQFDTIWKNIAAREPKAFAEDQQAYHKSVYYSPLRAHLDKYGIPNTNAINQVIWSTSTQHGPSWASKAFMAQKGMDEINIIYNIYKMREDQFKGSEYYNSSAARRNVRDSVLKRYKQEQKDAVNLIQR